MQELSQDDLAYLEKLLGEQFAQELERDKTWEQKNKYDRPGEKKSRIIRLINAIRSQKQMTATASQKW